MLEKSLEPLLGRQCPSRRNQFLPHFLRKL
jgi:hypothetical protein